MAAKQGFEIPLAEWVYGPLDGMIRESLLDPKGLVLDLMGCSGVKLPSPSKEKVWVYQIEI